MQRFAQSCQLRLPRSSACPFGSAYRAGSTKVQAKLNINEPDGQNGKESISKIEGKSPRSQQSVANQRMINKSLHSRWGQVTCLAPFADVQYEIRVANCDQDCTRTSTDVHEMTHVQDILDCCRRWRAAARPVFTASSPDSGTMQRLYRRWQTWVGNNEDYFESRAYSNSFRELRRLYNERNCNRPSGSNGGCCDRISRWMDLELTLYVNHHRQRRPLSPCPWPAAPQSGSPNIVRTDVCEGL
jgi:hypothetical protein